MSPKFPKEIDGNEAQPDAALARIKSLTAKEIFLGAGNAVLAAGVAGLSTTALPGVLPAVFVGAFAFQCLQHLWDKRREGQDISPQELAESDDALREALVELGLKEQQHFDSIKSVLAPMFKTLESLTGKVKKLEIQQQEGKTKTVSLLKITRLHQNLIRDLARSIQKQSVDKTVKQALNEQNLLSIVVNEEALVDKLRSQSEGVFKLVVKYAHVPHGLLPGAASSLAERAIELVNWARNGPGLGTIYVSLSRALTPAAETESPEVPVESVRDWFSPLWPVTDLKVFGRAEELALLDAAWDEGKLNIVVLVAAGGVGKTALVNHWIYERMQVDGWRGAKQVYALSFYSQGTSDDRQASAGMVIDEALRWFGHEEKPEDALDAYSKGYRLAELVRKKRTLLLLDGLEPLQEPTAAVSGHRGRVSDPGVKGLLKGLAMENPGLCVVSTRVPVADLASFASVGRFVHSEDLDDLTPDAGAAYLKSIGVEVGSDKEFRDASEAFGNHALALTLLGHLLVEHCDRDVRKRDEIPDLLHDEERGGHAMRVMAWYADEFEHRPEGELLHVLGLFDRPAEPGAIQALREGDAIEGLTTRLCKLSAVEWTDVVENLRKMRLVARDIRAGSGHLQTEFEGATRPAGSAGVATLAEGSHGLEGHATDESLDCHPLVREYFGERLERDMPEAWKAAHDRLYEYYKALPDKDLPDTIEEMAPLYQAVVHGCRAGRHEEVLKEIYYRRIQRGNKAYSTHKLGAFAAELSALAGLFDPPWQRPVNDLTEVAQAFVLSEAGYRLRALGRLAEAVALMQAGLDATAVQKDWKNAAKAARNLSELSLTLGRVARAVDYAEQGVRYADDSSDTFELLKKHATLANALHQAGRAAEARDAFREAEAMQEETQPRYPLLYSLRGFQYCDLVLAQGDAADAQRRGRKLFEWREQGDPLADMALDHLTLGRAELALEVEAENENFSEAEKHLDAAVDALRKAGTQHELPRGLLARAEMYRVRGDFAQAREDLEEAWEIAVRGGMRLFVCDTHLECARVLLDMAAADEALDPSTLAPDSPFRLYFDTAGGEVVPLPHAARGHVDAARRLVEETGYHRRDGEVEELAARLEAE